MQPARWGWASSNRARHFCRLELPAYCCGDGPVSAQSNKAAHAFCHCIPIVGIKWPYFDGGQRARWVVRLTGNSNPEETLAAAQARGLRHGAPFFLPYLSGERTLITTRTVAAFSLE